MYNKEDISVKCPFCNKQLCFSIVDTIDGTFIYPEPCPRCGGDAEKDECMDLITAERYDCDLIEVG